MLLAVVFTINSSPNQQCKLASGIGGGGGGVERQWHCSQFCSKALAVIPGGLARNWILQPSQQLCGFPTILFTVPFLPHRHSQFCSCDP